MELRVLNYFLAVAREQSISAAAESLHLSQPTLSTQLRQLEDELGKRLFIRGTKGSRRVVLTDEGVILRKRAEEILSLVHRTEDEIARSDDNVAGDIYIGAGETDIVRCFARAAKRLSDRYPDIHYHIYSGNAAYVTERLDKGLIDFGLAFGNVDAKKYDFMPIEARDTWGVLVRRDSPLASLEAVRPEDLYDKPLIVSRQEDAGHMLSRWLKRELYSLNVVATYNLVYNASLLVDEGLGCALCLDKLVNTEGSGLCFKPLDPALEDSACIFWKKFQNLSKPAAALLEELEAEMS